MTRTHPTHSLTTHKKDKKPHRLCTPNLGFSLIELMIVMVIIAVLASVAIPGFQDQVARSHVMGALSEVRSLTTAYEDLALRGVAEFELSDLGLKGSNGAQTERCRLSLQTPDGESGDGHIQCILQGSPRIEGATLTLSRNGQQGIWSCSSDLETAFRPQSCQAVNES